MFSIVCNSLSNFFSVAVSVPIDLVNIADVFPKEVDSNGFLKIKLKPKCN